MSWKRWSGQACHEIKTTFQPQVERLEDRLVPSTLPAGFTETRVTASGTLSSATAMEFSPNGQLWVIEQTGALKRVRANGSVHTARTLNVEAGGERGLLGLAFDPRYDGAGPNADFIYLYYTRPATASSPIHNRVSRFTIFNAGTGTPTAGGEVVLRNLPPEAEDGSTNHNGGAIHVGPDGKLYVAVGDHNYDTTPQSAHVSQILSSPFGKVLRLNLNGTNPSDNPFYNGGATNWRGSIWALGLRNPFTFAFQPGTGAMFINDVGERDWEEINRGAAGANFGWAGSTAPLWEGFEPAAPWANYRDPEMAFDHSDAGPTPFGCAITGGAFYPAGSQFGAAYAGKYFFADYCGSFIRVFNPNNPGSAATPDTSTPFAGNLTGGSPVDLKVDAAGNLYYLARGGVFRISFRAPRITGQPADRTVVEGQPVSFTVTAAGAAPLSYRWQRFSGGAWSNIAGATAATYTIASAALGHAGPYRAVVTNSFGSGVSSAATLTVNPDVRPPTITAGPVSGTVHVGQPASFSVTSAGAAPLSYQWRKFDGAVWNDIAGATAATFTIASAALADAGQFQVVVTNAFGFDTSAPATLIVNQLPTATISADATYVFGQTISFSATADDAEDGALPASAFRWEVHFGHDAHFHPHVAPVSGMTAGAFDANFQEPDPDQRYRILLTVTDSSGGSFTTSFDVLPQKVLLTLDSSPAGAALAIDGQPVSGPVESVIGMARTIQAPLRQTVGPAVWSFLSWSDGGAASHVIATPATDTTFTANYLLAPQGLIAAGSDAGGLPRVLVHNNDGSLRFDFLAFGAGFRGGVRVAMGDVNGDGTADVIAAAGRGGWPLVKIYSGLTGASLASFLAFDRSFRGGVHVAAGNFDADLAREIVVARGPGAPALVKVFNLRPDGRVTRLTGPLGVFFPFGRRYEGGVSVTAGNFDGRASDEVIAAKLRHEPRVIVVARVGNRREVRANFLAYERRFKGGVYVAAADVRGDARFEIITGAGRGRTPLVRIYRGGDARLLDQFHAYARGFTGGVRVGAVNRDGVGRADAILTTPGPGTAPLLRRWSWDGATVAEIDRFFAADPLFKGGAFVAGG